MRQLGFLSAFLFPLLAVTGWYAGGPYQALVPLFAFGLVPLLDAVIGLDHGNPSTRAPRDGGFYRLITWVYVPLQYLLVLWGAFVVRDATPGALCALILAVGITSGGVGITLAHELGHRNNRWEQQLSVLLLGTVCYQHFFIEHNLGHHRKVATPGDPATARLGESVYRFLPRSLWGGWLSAWQIEAGRLRKRGLRPWSRHNRMIGYSLTPVVWTVSLWAWLGSQSALFFLAQSLLAVILLEVINYVEHYGLVRAETAPGKFVKVQPHHSWNASFRVTNYLLFNLQRHSDHHAHATRRYHTLRHLDEAPQMPSGYAAMLLLALVPPLWFRLMNPKVAWARNHFVDAT